MLRRLLTRSLFTMAEENAILSDSNNITQQLSNLDIRQDAPAAGPVAGEGEEENHNNDRTLTNNSEVVVVKGSGKVKVRKGQTEEAYIIQRNQFQESGPKLNTITWLEDLDLDKLDANVKTDRTALESLTERLYFKRDYRKCLEVTEFALEFVKEYPNQKKIKNEIDELVLLRARCMQRLANL